MKMDQIGPELYSSLSLSSEGFVIIHNLQIKWMNERAEEIFGLVEARPRNLTIDNILSEDATRKIKTHRKSNSTDSLEINIPGKGMYEFRTGALGDSINDWVINIRDLNVYKRLIRSSERAELGLKNLIDNLNEGVILLYEGKIEYINTQGADILRDTMELCLGKSFIHFIHKAHQKKLLRRIENTECGVLTAYEEVRTIYAESDPDVGVSMVLTIYEDKPMVQVTLNDLRLRNILKREQVRAESLQLSNAALLDEIEEHKKTKEKLQKQQAETKEQKTRLQAVYDSSGDALMCTIDFSGLILVRNKTILNWSEKYLGDPIQPGDNLYKFLFEHRLQEKYQQEIKILQENVQNGIAQNFEMALRTTTGKDIWLQIHMAMIRPVGGRREVSVMMFDNSEKHATDKRIRDSLLEKEVLLKEVHHRVKNNMQLISSMLNLQSSYSSNDELSAILRECQGRIQSMAFIHEMIYRNPNFSGIDAADYLTLLCGQLIQGYSPPNTDLYFTKDIERVFLSLEEAIPMGLIVNELISNCLKHAFVGRKEGKLNLCLKEIDRRVHLSISDDGVGLKEEFGKAQTDSLGTQLVLALTQQLDGELSSERINGTRINIVFQKR